MTAGDSLLAECDMPPIIPAHITSQLQLPAQTTENELLTALESRNYSFPRDLLASPEARSSFIAELEKYPGQEVELLPCTPKITSYIYKEILFPNGDPIKIGCFPEILPTVSPPSSCEAVLMSRWLLDDSLDLSNWEESQAGKAIVIWPKSRPKDERALADVITTAIADAAVSSSISPMLSASSIQFDTLARFDDSFTKNLLAEALQEANPKWRFLSLYRILENSYLSSILQKINASFFDDPKRTIDQAAESIKNEIQQFLELAANHRLETLFDGFQDAFDALIANNKTLAIGLERSAANSVRQHSAKEKWQRGVIHCYKIRCAIAHAGGSGTFVERYVDWRNALEKLLPHLERLALTSLRISLHE